MSMILDALGGVWGKVLMVGAIAVAVLAILAGARSAGRKAERLEQAEKINEAVAEKSKRDQAVRIMSDDDVAFRVRQQRDELRSILQSR